MEALQHWLAAYRAQQWPTEVLAFQGVSDIPPFESHRNELKAPEDDPFYPF